MKAIINDLIAEQSLVDSLLDTLTEDQWKLPLDGCKPWLLQDAVNHIAFFDYAAVRLINHDFEHLLDGLDAEANQDEDYIPHAYRHFTGAETLQWWREERTKMTAKFMTMDPKERVPWAPGLPMSAKSLCTARMMELWAHSVDVYDALGLDVVVAERIKNVLFLSWQSRPFAYSINGLTLDKEVPIYLELRLPSGKVWAKGYSGSSSYIRGNAKDWAMVSVRRRHWMDTNLEIVGDEARRYANVVQCYAGGADPLPEPKNISKIRSVNQ